MDSSISEFEQARHYSTFPPYIVLCREITMAFETEEYISFQYQ